jgi:hypothetical protein
VSSLSVIDREDCPTSRKELGVFDVVHCDNRMTYFLCFVNQF